MSTTTTTTPAPEVSLTAAAFAIDARRPRSRQTVLGASDIGPCLRRAAYIYHGVPKSDETSFGMPAVLGTWLHTMGLDALERVYGIFPEILMEHPSGEIRGHTDAIWLSEEYVREFTGVPWSLRVQGHAQTTLEDLKTKADDRLIDQVRKYGPPLSERRQVYTYIWLMSDYGSQVDMVHGNRRKQGLLADIGPLRIDRVRLRYLARDRGDELVWEEDVDPAMISEARERFEFVQGTETPSDAPREQRGPGLSYVCDSCPFVTECWGASAIDENGVWPQHIRVVEGETDYHTETANYLQGMVLEKEGKTLKEDAKAVLSGVQTETEFSGAGKVKWTGGRPKGEVEDLQGMRDLLLSAGVPIPMKDGGTTTRSISVRPPKDVVAEPAPPLVEVPAPADLN